MNLASVNPALLKASLNPELRSSTLGLKICLIVTLTAEAELHHLAPPAHAESRQHCLNAVLKLVGGDLSVIGTVLAAVGKILSDLISVVLPLVDGLLAALLPLIGSLVPVLTTLAFNTLAGVLTLPLSL